MGNDVGASVRATTPAVLRIAWSHPKHELLSKDEDTLKKSSIPVVRVVVRNTSVKPDGGAEVELSPSGTPTGQVEFVVPSDWDKLAIVLEFAPKFAKRSFPVDGGKRVERLDPEIIIQKMVFRVRTELARGGAGGPKVRPKTDEGAELEHRLYHPATESTNEDAYFMKWPAYSMDGTRSITTLRVEPDLVDVTELWRELSASVDVSIFERHVAEQQKTQDYPPGEGWDALRIYAPTHSETANLFAVFFPAQARERTKKISTFVMFTPSGYDTYNSIASTNGPAVSTQKDPVLGPRQHNQYVWNRYLLKGLRNSPWALGKDYLTVWAERPEKINVAIPVGFSAAVEKSKKPMVLILPLAQGDTSYGDWMGNHDRLLTRIIQLLWKNNHIAQGEADPPDIHRQGLGGFSRAAGVLIPAVQANPAVSLLCCFDGQGSAARTRFTESFPVSTWLSGGKRRIFCLTAGLMPYLGSNVKQEADNLAKLFPKRVFAHPQDDGFWGPYSWPDPDEPVEPPPNDEASEPNTVGSWWVRLIRPSNPPEADPFSMKTHASLAKGLFRAPGTLPRPISHLLAISRLSGFSGVPDTPLQDLAHQFAIAGGGQLTDPAGSSVGEMSYLQCIFTHWSGF